MAQYRRDLQRLDPADETRFEMFVQADRYGNPIGALGHPSSMSFGDSASITAFGRARTAEARLLGEYRYMYGSGTSMEMNDHLEGAGSITMDYVRVCALASVTGALGDRAVRQSKQYHPYIAGTSNIGSITFTFNAAKAGLQQSVGMFDDQNGFFLRMNGTVVELVIRKGGVDTEVVPQSAWTVNRFDGSTGEFNPTSIQVDWTKSQILVIDYQWLGIGRVRFGLVIDGAIYYLHYFSHANHVTEVYTNQPSLPVRWEIYNAAATGSSSTLMAICGSVYCEGADSETGFSRSASTGSTPVSITNTTPVGILGVRLKNTLVGKPNHALARLKNWAVLSGVDFRYKIVILPDSSYLANGATFNSVPGLGWCEYATNFALATGWEATNQYAVLIDGFVSGGQGSNTGQNAPTLLDNRSNAIYQNYGATDSQILAIIGYRLTNNATVSASLMWSEVK